ncbi:MAG: BamA/TamA family outer membrane protein [Planctomycetota bacterium]
MRYRFAGLLLALLATAGHAQVTDKPAAAQTPQGQSAPPEAAPGQAGPPAPAPKEAPIVRSIVVEGEERYSEAQLISALGQKIGEPLDNDVINRGLRTIWISFSVRAESFVRELPAALGARPEVELRLVVVEMPSDREPRFVGNVDIDKKTLKRWALLEDRVELFEYQANRVRQRLLEGYRREGYHWVEIEVVKRDSRDDPGALGVPMTDLIFEIREGPKVRVKNVEVIGNQSMPDTGFLFWKSGLSSFTKRQLSEPGPFSWWGSAFVQETLDADVVAMREVYRERGWLDAVVDAETHFSEDGARVRIKYVIDEGQPYTVEGLDVAFFEWVQNEDKQWQAKPIEASKARFTPAQVLAKCELKPGDRYEEIERTRDEAKLREFYGSVGCLFHPSLPPDMRWQFLEPELFYSKTEHKLRVTYRIVEGHPLTIREVTFAGSHHTRDEVLRREVGLVPGSKADQKEINRALSRIEGTGFFTDSNNPEDHVDPTYRFFEVPGSKDLVDLQYEVEEGRVILFNLAGGLSTTEGAFGTIELTVRNFDWSDGPSKWTRSFHELFRKEAFHGAGELIEIKLSPGTKRSYARVRYLDPDIFNRYLEPISLDVGLNRSLSFNRSHDEERFDKYLKFGRRFGFDTSVSAGIVHNEVEVSDLSSAGVPTSLQRQDALGKVNLVGVTLDFSTRKLDNQLNPHNGWKLGLRNTVFNKLLSSDFEYVQTRLDTDFYVATGTKSDGTEHVLHLELDGGIAPTFGDTTEVPYTERFFQGGSNLRGFDRYGAGARGVDVLGGQTQYAAGGESFLSGSVEWLYPLYSITQPGTYKKIETLRGMLFFDWGVLGQDAFDIDLNDTRASVGFGIGLANPLPIQLNFGFPIRRFSGDEQQTFSFSIGLSF